MDDTGCRLEEMKDLFLQRELRLEQQMGELNTRMHTLSAAVQGEKPKPDTPTSFNKNFRGAPCGTYSTARLGGHGVWGVNSDILCLQPCRCPNGRNTKALSDGFVGR